MANIIAKNSLLRSQLPRMGISVRGNYNFDYSNFVKGPTLPGTISSRGMSTTVKPTSVVFNAEVHKESLDSDYFNASVSAEAPQLNAESTPSISDLADLLPDAPKPVDISSDIPVTNVVHDDLNAITSDDTIQAAPTLAEQANTMFPISNVAETVAEGAAESTAGPAILPFMAMNSIGNATASLYSSNVKDQLSSQELQNSSNPDPGIRYATSYALNNQLNIASNSESTMRAFSFAGPLNMMFSGPTFTPPSVNDTGTITDE